MASVSRIGPEIPDHVPAGLYWDNAFEKFASEGDDPFRQVASLHAGPDIFYARDTGINRPGWILTRNAHIREAFADPTRFCSFNPENFLAPIGLDVRMTPLEFDPPEHFHYRKAIEPYFTPAAVNALDGAVRAVCEQLLAGFTKRDSCEFISEFAEPFPSHIFLDLMGMPRERLADFLAWERSMIRPVSAEDAVTGTSAVISYLEEFIREQRVRPTTDQMRGVLAARYNNERPFTEKEILGVCFILYIGGLDTVYSTLGWIFRHLAQDPVLQRRLRE